MKLQNGIQEEQKRDPLYLLPNVLETAMKKGACFPNWVIGKRRLREVGVVLSMNRAVDSSSLRKSPATPTVVDLQQPLKKLRRPLALYVERCFP